MSDLKDKHVISILVDNEFGALARIVSLFSARGYNIENLSVAVVDEKQKLSRVTITTYGSQTVIDLILKLLNRLIPVHKAVDFSMTTPHIERSLALIKINNNNDEKKLDEILRMAKLHKAEMIEKENDYLIFEIMDEPNRIDVFIKLLEPFGVIEVTRTGPAAIALSAESM